MVRRLKQIKGNDVETTKVKNLYDSCDFCESQDESKHYCLLHGEIMKNMNIKRCKDWSDGTPRKPQNSSCKDV